MTAKLSVYEYFKVLQLEWIVADLRSRIYPQPKDKAFWSRVKEGKERKITTIAEKNSLPTIFVDEEMKRIFEGEVYKKTGMPGFIYKDEAQKATQEPLDLMYYFSRNSEVRFEDYGELKIGKIKSFVLLDVKSVVTIIDESGKEYKVPYKEVTRIL